MWTRRVASAGDTVTHVAVNVKKDAKYVQAEDSRHLHQFYATGCVLLLVAPAALVLVVTFQLLLCKVSSKASVQGLLPFEKAGKE